MVDLYKEFEKLNKLVISFEEKLYQSIHDLMLEYSSYDSKIDKQITFNSSDYFFIKRNENYIKNKNYQWEEYLVDKIEITNPNFILDSKFLGNGFRINLKRNNHPIMNFDLNGLFLSFYNLEDSYFRVSLYYYNNRRNSWRSIKESSIKLDQRTELNKFVNDFIKIINDC